MGNGDKLRKNDFSIIYEKKNRFGLLKPLAMSSQTRPIRAIVYVAPTNQLA